jgi:hypothetical protein
MATPELTISEPESTRRRNAIDAANASLRLSGMEGVSSMKLLNQEYMQRPTHECDAAAIAFFNDAGQIEFWSGQFDGMHRQLGPVAMAFATSSAQLRIGKLFLFNADRSLPARRRCSTIPSQQRSFNVLFVYSTSDGSCGLDAGGRLLRPRPARLGAASRKRG